MNPTILFFRFTGCLSLVDLFVEGEMEFQTLRAVCDLCPNITKLLLLEAGVRAKDRNAETYREDQIIACFNKLKKVVWPCCCSCWLDLDCNQNIHFTASCFHLHG